MTFSLIFYPALAALFALCVLALSKTESAAPSITPLRAPRARAVLPPIDYAPRLRWLRIWRAARNSTALVVLLVMLTGVAL